jgi:hypothetical protein
VEGTVLKVLNVALKSLEERLASCRSGKITASVCQNDIERGLRRLHDKLDLAPAIIAAFDRFEEASTRFTQCFDRPAQRAQRDNAFDGAMVVLATLRLALDDARMPYAARNEILEFAAHTRRNLDHVLRVAGEADLHPVTQIIVSMVGLVVFPVEKLFEEVVRKKPLAELTGWPPWNISLGEAQCRTLGELATRLRNAVSHRHILFSSDSREPSEVVIEFEDYKPSATVPHWRADISADELCLFCVKFTDYIDAVVG